MIYVYIKLHLYNKHLFPYQKRNYKICMYTELGLAVGIGASVFFFLVDYAFTSSTHPVTVASCKDNNGVDMVTLQVRK